MKKLISLLLALAITLPMCVAYAADPKISGTSVDAYSGETVELSFKFKNNPGIAEAEIMLVWDKSVLSLTDDATEIGDVFADGTVTEDRATNGKFYIYWSNDANVTDDGDMFTLTFKISDDANISNYFISIGVNKLQNASGETVKTALSLPNISVIGDPEETATPVATATPTPTSKPQNNGGGTVSKPTATPTVVPTEAPTKAPENAENDLFKSIFGDIKETDWYYESVKYAYTNGLMNGTSDTEFEPNLSLTRAMLVTVLWRLENEPVVNFVMPFEDVSEDAWYAEAVRWAVCEGIVNGVEDTKFAPDSNITREQIATIIYRYAQYKDVAPTGAWAIKLDYADLADISDYAVDGVMYCKLKEIMQGKDDSNFVPKDNATRAEIATILQRFIEANK